MKTLKNILVFFAFSLALHAQTAKQQIDSLNTYFNDYSDALRGYRLAVRSDTTLTSTQKYDLYILKKEALREQFKQERRQEYLSLNGIELSLEHSCTKEYSGGTKDCGTLYLYVPEGFIKTTGSFRYSGVGTKELPKGGSITLKKSGRGRIEGKIYFKIEIDLQWLELQLTREARKLIGDIVLNHQRLYPHEGPYW